MGFGVDDCYYILGSNYFVGGWELRCCFGCFGIVLNGFMVDSEE